ncbi:hypothetical protein Tco_0933455 [Tanacetum coccineum]
MAWMGRNADIKDCIAKRSIDSKEGRDGGGFVVLGGRSSRESNNACREVGGVEKMSSTESKCMVRGEECLEGYVGAGGREVNGGGEDLGVSKSLLGEIPCVVIDQRGVAIMREGTATKVNQDESGATCDGNPTVISLFLYFLTFIQPPRGPYDIDVAATFRVPLRTVGDLHMLINDIEAGKHDELLSEMTNDDCMETLDALGTICNSIQADKNVILNESDSIPKGVPSIKAPNTNTSSIYYPRPPPLIL